MIQQTRPRFGAGFFEVIMNKARIASAAFAAIAVLALSTCFCACSDARELPDWAFDSLYAADVSRAEGSDARVMSVNMLVHMESWGGEPVEPRAQLAEKFFDHYSPDVVALQELCGDWYKRLEGKPDGYAFVHDGKTKTNMIYDADRLSLVDSGYFEYEKRDNSGCRAVAWGVFLTEDGKKFAVTSTHFDLGTEKKKVEYRTSQIAQLAEHVKYLAGKYDCPVIAAGDYNVLEGEDYGDGSNYDDLVAEIGGADARYASASVICDEPFVDEHSDNLWDHMIFVGNAQPLEYRIVTEPFFRYGEELAMTDHYPISCDLAF